MSIFAEPALLVPIHVDALAVGEQPREESFQWTRSTPAFEKLEDDFFLGPKLAGDPFDQAPPLPSGVHLHFRLPHAFAQGRQKAGSPLTFPSIPNRWLVLRIVLDGGPRASHQAWLIRSDQRVSADGVAWPDFADGAVSVIHIGAAEELNAPPVAEDDDSDLQLTAVGVARREAKTSDGRPAVQRSLLCMPHSPRLSRRARRCHGRSAALVSCNRMVLPPRGRSLVARDARARSCPVARPGDVAQRQKVDVC